MITLPYTGNYTLIPLVGNSFDMRMNAGDYNDVEFATLERIIYRENGEYLTIHVNLPSANPYNMAPIPPTTTADGLFTINYNGTWADTETRLDPPVGRYYPSLDQTKTIIGEQFKDINPKDMPALKEWLLTLISPIKNLPVQEGGNI